MIIVEFDYDRAHRGLQKNVLCHGVGAKVWCGVLVQMRNSLRSNFRDLLVLGVARRMRASQ
jgi:hypothetical protein